MGTCRLQSAQDSRATLLAEVLPLSRARTIAKCTMLHAFPLDMHDEVAAPARSGLPSAQMDPCRRPSTEQTPCWSSCGTLTRVRCHAQDPVKPAVLRNRGNEYLHYEDDWYILGFKPDKYALIYYKGNNDAWQGYGGATVYTKCAWGAPRRCSGTPMCRDRRCKLL